MRTPYVSSLAILMNLAISRNGIRRMLRCREPMPPISGATLAVRDGDNQNVFIFDGVEHGVPDMHVLFKNTPSSMVVRISLAKR